MTDTHTTEHIPDEAVTQAAKLAAVKAYTEVEGKCRPVAMTAALTAALPHLSAPCAVEVDKLHWDGLVGFVGSFSYVVAPPSFTKGWRVWGKLSDKSASIGGVLITSTAANKEEAKAAAQADFERRILSCVVTKPADVSGGYMTREEIRLENLKQIAKYDGQIISFECREPYYLASCDSCGWVGSSELCGTDSFGDDSDVYCPRCQSSGADCGKVAERLSAKPIDVAAVREECAQIADDYDQTDTLSAPKTIAAAIRALSAEPAQADQWQDISTAEERAFDVILQIPDPTRAKGYKEVIGHWAQDLSGEEQPPFRGWFTDAGFGFREVYPAPTHWRRLPPATPTKEAVK